MDSGRRLDMLCLAAISLLLLGSAYLAFTRVAEQRERVGRENQIFNRRLKDLDQAQSNLQKLNAALEASRRELALLNERVPEKAQVGEFLALFDRFLKERGVSLISVQPLPVEDERLYARIPLRMMFHGSFDSVYKLLGNLETMNRVMVMDKLVVSRPDLDQNCRVDLTASLFARTGK